MGNISIFSQFKKYSALEKKVEKTTVRALKFLKKKTALVEIFLIPDVQMRKINKEFRKKDEATNVLSFAESESGKFLKEKNTSKKLGEIYIAPDFIKKHKQVLEHMVVHGLLHLCGYDHMTKKDAEKMEKKEAEIFKSLSC